MLGWGGGGLRDMLPYYNVALPVIETIVDF